MFWDIFTLRKVADLLFMVHRPFVNRDRIVTLAIAKGKLGLGWICFTRTRNLDREREALGGMLYANATYGTRSLW